MFASLQIHAQILGRRALSGRAQGLGTVAFGVLLAATLAGCGQKGPLFLPVPPPPLATSITAPVQAIPVAPNRPVSPSP
ncbi:MAG: lipoprotein [Polaromonas sp.]|nr:lipoprotein [Polaromonas sp.]